eukprot:COSAG01_NODE_32513_length_579_cov_83.731250_2_plen_61_part_01
MNVLDADQVFTPVEWTKDTLNFTTPHMILQSTLHVYLYLAKDIKMRPGDHHASVSSESTAA